MLYWCQRIREESEVIAPGSGEDPIQFIDVNDLGRFSSCTHANGISRIFNVTGPRSTAVTWRQFLNVAKNHFQSSADLIWAPEEFLRENNIKSFSDMPLWVPLSEDRGFMQISNQKLMNTGFQLSPISDTLNDVMKWYSENLPSDIDFGSEETGVGLSRLRELQLIKDLPG